MFNANEDMFLRAFDSTPKLNLCTQKKLELELAKVTGVISNPTADWNLRLQAMKHFRSLVQSGAAECETFITHTLKTLEVPFQNNICDLRSQVVRETCITIAFLSCRLQHKFSRMAEVLLASLIKLIPNSAKIVSSSAFVALGFIIQSTHNSRLIPIIKYQLSTSKSKEIHRGLCEIAERMITIWPPQVIERHINDYIEVLRLGIHNPDEMARQSARRAFNLFADHFREPADHLFNSLDQTRQRMLNNLNHGGGSTLSMNGCGSATKTTTLHFGRQPSFSSLNRQPRITTYSPRPRAPVNLVSRLKSSLTITNNQPHHHLHLHQHQQPHHQQPQQQMQPQQQPHQIQQQTPVHHQQAPAVETRDGLALSKAASYLLSVISNNTISEPQLVTTIKYLNSLIEKHAPDLVNENLNELMPPLTIGINNGAIAVRKASVFAMVAIHNKIGLKQMESYLNDLTMTQRKLFEVYIKKTGIPSPIAQATTKQKDW